MDEQLSEQSTSIDLIKLETFEKSTFSVSDLLAHLTEGHIKDDKENKRAFQPDPFIETLEKSIQKLIPLRKQVESKILNLEQQVSQNEREYRNKVDVFKNGLDDVSKEFSGLDSRITEVGKTVIRIGERLESIDRVRSRASEAHDIILYYNEFSRGETNRIESIRKEGKEGRRKVAKIVKRLLSVTRDLEGLEGGDVTKATIEKYAERFEKDMLRLFEKAYLKGEPKAMAHCAQTLLEFNGGHSCIQIYVNQHDFFISRERIDAVNYVTEDKMWEGLGDPNKPSPKSEPELTNLYSDIRDQISQEAQIIEAVFPQPVVVMQVFLQRVFAQVVQGHIEKLMTAAQGSSTLAFLRVLAIARSSTAQLINDLKSHDFFRSSLVPTNPSSSSFARNLSIDRIGDGELNQSTEMSRSQIRGSSAGIAVSALSSMLDQQLDELFSQHLDNGRYLDRECKCITELYASYLLKFTRWHRSVNKAKPSNTLFDRMVNQLSTAATQSTSTATPTTPTPTITTTTTTTTNTNQTNPTGNMMNQGSGLKSLLKLSGLKSTDNNNNEEILETEVEISDGDGDLNLDVVEKMLIWHADCIGRMIELSPTNEVPKNAFGLFKTLTESLCKGYLETSLDTNLIRLTNYDSKTEPDLKMMKIIKVIDSSMNLWQGYIKKTIEALVSSSVQIRRELSIFNNQVLVRIESKIDLIVKKALECVLVWLNVCLNKQKRNDFKPKNDEIEFSKVYSETCLNCCEFLNLKVLNVITMNDCLNGNNLLNFLSEIGIVFHSMLLEHLKKFPVSAIGGLMLNKDLGMYQETINKFKIPRLNERFEMIREIGNIYIIQPNVLRSYLLESVLKQQIEDLRLLKPFLMMRSDYNDYPKKFWDDEILGGIHNNLSIVGNGQLVGSNQLGTSTGGGGQNEKGWLSFSSS